MEKAVEELYQRAKRFDEGDIYQSEEYTRLVREQSELGLNIRARLGLPGASLLEDYTAVLGDMTELECRHFFEQGYLLGRAASASADGRK